MSKYDKVAPVYGVAYGDGTMCMQGNGEIWVRSFSEAEEMARDYDYQLEQAHIPQSLWPKVMRANMNVTYTDWQEVTDADTSA